MKPFPILRMGMRGGASITVGAGRTASYLMREIIETDEAALMHGVPQRIFGAMGRAITRVGEVTSEGAALRAAKSEANATRRAAAFAAMSEEEQARAMARRRTMGKVSLAGSVGVGVGLAAVAAPIGFGLSSIAGRGSRFPMQDAGIVGYPGTAYTPPPDLGADGDLVLAAHKTYGAGSKNRDMK